MTKKSTDIVRIDRVQKCEPDVSKSNTVYRTVEQRAEATAELVKLMIHGGNVFLDMRRMEAESARDWDRTRQRIAEIDATTQAELTKLEAQLLHQKDKTLRLRLVLDVIATKGETLPEIYGKGLSMAVEQLTRE